MSTSFILKKMCQLIMTSQYTEVLKLLQSVTNYMIQFFISTFSLFLQDEETWVLILHLELFLKQILELDIQAEFYLLHLLIHWEPKHMKQRESNRVLREDHPIPGLPVVLDFLEPGLKCNHH